MADLQKWQDLIDIIARLRGKDGCPWDRKQDHFTLKRYLLEECYEVIDAIDREDDAALCEELGDVLLQVVLHSQIATEENKFTIDDVVDNVSQKMIRRHPHIFGEAHAEDAEQVLSMWEKIKAEEKGDQGHEKRRVMKINENLPALMLAQKAQDKAHRVGFDWANIDGAEAKLAEELDELAQAQTNANRREELGDVLFSLVNMARFMDIDAEDALRSSVRKFIRRFSYIEDTLDKRGLQWEDVSLADMDAIWNEAKLAEGESEL